MTFTTSGQVLRNLSFFLIANQLSTNLIGMSYATGTGNRDVYIPPDIDAMSSDARKWYLQGVANANKDLESKFKELVTKVGQGEDVSALYKEQLTALLGQAEDANENSKVLAPKLAGLVDSLNEWSQDPISYWSAIKLKATVWYVNGKRDNKSYYLQNGGGLWCKERFLMLKPISGDQPKAKEMEEELRAFGQQLLLARDELDDAAQIYVKGINSLDLLTGDVCKNAEEIRAAVKIMKESGDERMPRILSSSQKAVDWIKTKIDGIN